MRLDEWQKYIGAQFLDEEEAIPAPKPVAQTLSPFPAFLPSEETAKPSPDVKPDINVENVPDKPESRLVETPLPGARPETAPNSIQNVVTMVVAPTQSPDVQSTVPRAPHVELLTPIPEQKPVQAATEAQTAVSNRTRRRSQSNASQAPAEFAAIPILTESAPLPPAANPILERNLFQPLEDFNADIPSFASYLPAAHSAASPAVVSCRAVAHVANRACFTAYARSSVCHCASQQ